MSFSNNLIHDSITRLDIDPNSKKLLISLVCAELFNAIRVQSHVVDLKTNKVQKENDSRVFVEVSFVINVGDPIVLFKFRPFIDKSCTMQNVSNGIRLQKSYFLYDTNTNKWGELK